MRIIVNNKTIRRKMLDMNVKSISELSRLSGVSRPKIYQYLNGSTPFATTFVKLCKFLNLDPSKMIIIYDDDDENREVIKD